MRANRAEPRQRRNPRPLTLLIITAILGPAVLASACAPAPPPPERVIVYGDSLLSESATAVAAQIRSAHPGVDVIIRSVGGTAHCDWRTYMADDSTALKPKAVVIAFSGNMLTECTRGRGVADLYRTDAEWSALLYATHGISVAYVGTPAAAGLLPSVVPEQYRQVARAHNVPFIDATPRFIDPETGLAAATAACLPGEGASQGCVNGRIQIRNQDGAHLCQGPTDARGACTVYSSGVRRFTDAVAEAATTALRNA